MKFIYIALGGGLGSILRYIIASFGNGITSTKFPWGTLIVNLLGSFLIGLAWGYAQRSNWNENLSVFLFVGLFGGFTTFSSFALEVFILLKANEVISALSYLFLSLFLGVILVYLGILLTK